MIAGWSSPVARQAHNLKVVGSNPTPATNSGQPDGWPFLSGFSTLFDLGSRGLGESAALGVSGLIMAILGDAQLVLQNKLIF